MAIFLSYSHEDSATADELGRILAGENVKIWRDVWRVPPGETFEDRIRDAINHATVACFMISRHSSESRWVELEVRLASERAARDPNLLLLPILLDDSTPPPQLSDRVFVDLRCGRNAGFQRVVEIVKKLERRPQHGQVSPDPYYIDFGHEGKLNDRLYSLEVDVVSFDTEEQFTILTQFEFVTDIDDVWKELDLSEPSLLPKALLSACAEQFLQSPGWVRLSVGKVHRTSFTLNDGTGRPLFTVHTRINLLGRVPPLGIAFNVGALFQQVLDGSDFG